MHGNVWEWCLDDWHENYRGAPINGHFWSSNPKNEQIFINRLWVGVQTDNWVGVQTDSAVFQKLTDFDNEQPKLLRGGSWFNNLQVCRSANRSRGRAVIRGFFNDIGFRVVVLP
jgi:formylglycine-generating enzyme required for sulfatase activity